MTEALWKTRDEPLTATQNKLQKQNETVRKMESM